MTFSIVAKCEKTGMFGIAISSSSPAVAARCAFAKTKVGAVASQNITDPRLGGEMIRLMQQGKTAKQAVEEIRRQTKNIEYRQLSAVDNNGGTGTFSGEYTLGIHATYETKNVACAGNLLATKTIPKTMADRFLDSSESHIGDKLINAMVEALNEGGEEGPVRSAGMIVVDEEEWPVVSLRVDWHEDPIGQLKIAWDVYKPQIDDYIVRANNPKNAPGFRNETK